MRLLLIIPILFFHFHLVAGTPSGEIRLTVTDKTSGEEIPFVVVIVRNSTDTLSAVTDFYGKAKMNLNPGNYEASIMFIGYEPRSLSITVPEDTTLYLKIELEPTPSEVLEEFQVIDYSVPLIDKSGGAGSVTINRNDLRRMPSGNPKCISSQVGGVVASPRQAQSRERYEHQEENTFKSVHSDPLSTLSIDVDNASYTNVRRFINMGQLPPADAVRIEEMVNYFDYDYPQPTGEHPFSVTTEYAKCPWNEKHTIARVGIQGKTVQLQDLPPNNLVFLIDVSGSMDVENKLPLVQKSLKLLVDSLRNEDRVALVVYAGSAGVVLESTKANEKGRKEILEAINRLQAGGSTAGGEGIQKAYEIAEQNLISKGNNRVILCTDGDFNVGVTDDDALVKMMKKNKDKGIFLTVLGYGMGNYQDARLEKIADKGDGNYAYIDNMLEAQNMLVNQMTGTLLTIAKDVKIQIEFNPQHVKQYRLIGYENRVLNAEDFNDDKKDAGELGAGHTVTAIYEIIPGSSPEVIANVDPLRYQELMPTKDGDIDGEMMTVKLRYKDPDGSKSKLIIHSVDAVPVDDEVMSADLRFASAVVQFGMLLSDSEHAGSAGMKEIIAQAKDARGEDENGRRAEFIQLVRSARLLK